MPTGGVSGSASSSVAKPVGSPATVASATSGAVAPAPSVNFSLVANSMYVSIITEEF